MAAAGRREGELGVRRGDTVAVGRSGAGTAGCAAGGAESTVTLPSHCLDGPFNGQGSRGRSTVATPWV